MVKKFSGSFDILPNAVYIFAITVLLVVSGYFLFWLGKNAGEVEERVETGVKTVYRNVTRVGGDIVDYVEDSGEQYYRAAENEIITTTIPIQTTEPVPPTTPMSPTMPPTMPPTTPPEDCPNLLIKRGNQLVLYNKNKPEKDGENPIYFKNLDEYIYYVKVQRVEENKNCPVLYLQEETTAQGEDVYRIRPGPFHTQGGAPPCGTVGLAQYFQGTPAGVPILGNQPVVQAPKPFNQSGLPNGVSLMKNGAPVTEPPTKRPTVPYLDANSQMNPGAFYGFDPTNQYVGKYTILDKIHDSTKTQNSNGLSDNPMDPNWGGAVFTNKQIQSGKYTGDLVEVPTKKDLANTSAPTQGAAPVIGAATTSPAPNTMSPSPAPNTMSPSPASKSDNPMDVNWSGVSYAQFDAASGKYKGDDVKIAVNE